MDMSTIQVNRESLSKMRPIYFKTFPIKLRSPVYTSAQTVTVFMVILWLYLSNFFVLRQSMRNCTIRNVVRGNVGCMKDLKTRQYGTFYISVGKTGHQNDSSWEAWTSKLFTTHTSNILQRYRIASHSSSIFPLGSWTRIFLGFLGEFA